MTSTFTLRLLRLECLRPQELDGDEPYLIVDDVRIWETPRGDHMVREAEKAGQFSVVDFVQGRRMMQSGWDVFGMVFDAARYTLANQTGFTQIRLKESDWLTSDDDFGLAVASAQDAGRGEIQVNFTADGAEYLLVYRVDLD